MSVADGGPQMQALVQQESLFVFGFIGILLIVDELVLALLESSLNHELVVKVG